MLFIISSSLALAVTINTDKTDYNHPDLVNIEITGCTGLSVLRASNANIPDPALVFIDDGSGDWSTTYNTASDSSDGKYTLFVSCADGTDTKYFCVNADGCLGSLPAGDGGATPGGTTPADDGSGDGSLPAGDGSDGGSLDTGSTPPSGGGGGCRSDFSCSSWSYCNKDLKEIRVCVDQNNCRSDRTESRDCDQCQESWVCLPWSVCQNGINLRNCFDEHQCGTALQEPSLQKSCQAANALGPAPVRTVSQLPNSVPPIEKAFSLKSLWSNYKVYFISAPIGLILLILIIILITRLTKPKGHAANFDELKEWITEERKLGTSDEQIRQTLKGDTNWKESEVEDAFKELSGNKDAKDNL